MFPPNRLCTSTLMDNVSNFTEAFWKTLVPGRDIESFAKGFFSRKTHLSQGIGRSDQWKRQRPEPKEKKTHRLCDKHNTHLFPSKRFFISWGITLRDFIPSGRFLVKTTLSVKNFAAQRFAGCTGYHVSDSPAYWELVQLVK